MIQPTELRIGNLVFNKHGDLHVIGYNCFQRFRTPSMDGNPSGFTPIPLSEEWLKRMGCTKISEVGNVWETPNEITFNFHPSNHCGLITFGARHVNFHYVHTFQNIIALTGSELTINL